MRQKVEHILEKAGFPVAGHDRKALQHILETFPRDEMFQFNEDELYNVSMGILQVRERHKLGLFLRRDLFGRFVTALVYVPRDRYDTRLRQQIQQILMQALEGQACEFNIQLSESPLARVHFIIRTRPDKVIEYDEAELQALMTEAMVSWQDSLLTALYKKVGEVRATQLFDRYSELSREVLDCILLMQVGAFMQVMDANARSVSRITGLKLQVAGDVDDPKVLGGFPISGLDKYVGMLVRAGHSVAIALQDHHKERHLSKIIRVTCDVINDTAEFERA